MKTIAIALTAFGLGAALMYVGDPLEGRRRRAHLRELAAYPRSRRFRKDIVKLMAR